MKKIIFLLLLSVSAMAQDTTLKPITNVRKPPRIFVGAGLGYNHLKTNRYQAIQTRNIFYVSGGFTVKRWTFQANIGNSIISTNVNYYFW